jgi:hypothetical protein
MSAHHVTATVHPQPLRRRHRADARGPQRIGDITLTPDTVATPSGWASTKHVEWQVDDGSTPPQRTGSPSVHATSTAVVGTVRVTATAPGWKHVTAVPVSTLDDVIAIYSKVLHARRIARQHGSRRRGG